MAQDQFRDIEFVKRLFLQIINQYELVYFTGKSSKMIESMDEIERNLDQLNYFETFMKEVKKEIDDIIHKYGSQTKTYSNYINRALEYTSENYATIEGITELADSLGINSEYFCRLFKNEVGCTYITNLNNHRMKKAKELLENTDLKIYEIAERVGYSNISYFSRIYKKIYHMSPYETRNQ